jgi:hypothetical protein
VTDTRPPLTVPFMVGKVGADPPDGEVPLSPPHADARPVTVSTAANW